MLTPEAEIRFVSHALFVTLTFSMLCSFFAGCPNTCLDRFSYHNLWKIRVCLTGTLKTWQSVTYCRGDKYDELHDRVRSRYVTIIILTMALLCASSILRARYPFCLLSARRIATEAGQVCLQFFWSAFAQFSRSWGEQACTTFMLKMVPRWSLLPAILCRYHMRTSARVRHKLLSSSKQVLNSLSRQSQPCTAWCRPFRCGPYGPVKVWLWHCISYSWCSIHLHSFRGKTATEFLEWLTPSSLSLLAPYSSTLSVILNENGGIIDDTVITKHATDAFYVVTNASRRDRDLTWFKQKLEEWNASEKAQNGRVEMEVLENWGLLALQGSTTAFVVTVVLLLIFFQFPRT